MQGGGSYRGGVGYVMQAGVGHTAVGWGMSCRDLVGHTGVA